MGVMRLQSALTLASGLCLLGVSAQAEQLVVDFANGPGSLFEIQNTAGLWTVDSDGPTLRVSKPEDPLTVNPHGFIAGGVRSRFSLEGDFQVTVDYELIDFQCDLSNGSTLNESILGVEDGVPQIFEVLRFAHGSGNQAIEAYGPDSPIGGEAAPAEILWTGRYRISRVGQTMTGFFAPLGSEDFTTLGSAAGYGDPVEVFCLGVQGVGRADRERANTALDIAFDNLIIEGTIDFPSPMTYHVHADGTGDFPTIQAAINAAADGDTIELANGVFLGVGNRDIDYLGKGITVRSGSGDPDSCVIDCQGTPSQPHRGFYFRSGEDASALLSGLTIANGYSTEGGIYSGGGAISCAHASPRIANCVFVDNTAEAASGALLLGDGAATVTGCTFIGNTAPSAGAICCTFGAAATITACTFIGNTGSNGSGGALALWEQSSHGVVSACTFIENSASASGGGIFLTNCASGTFSNCTLVGNSAPHGGGVSCWNGATASCDADVIAGNLGGGGVMCSSGGSAVFSCSDIFGNVGGDWVGSIENQYGVEGNISDDPLFCDPSSNDLRLQEESPCAPSGDCGVMGAWPVGCEGLEPTVYLVEPDGSGDYPTIQAAVDAAAQGDIVELGDGVFQGDGNRDVNPGGKVVTIRSASGNPASCVIDCQGSAVSPHRGFAMESGEGPLTVLTGITITNGYSDAGGAVLCRYSSSPTITGCVFVGNEASARGGGIACAFSSSPSISGCTIAGNTAPAGGGVSCSVSSSPGVDNTIIAFNSQGEAVYCGTGCPVIFQCCDFYGNEGGDWIGSIGEQAGIAGNFSADPCFCDLPSADVTLWNYSPCLQVSCGLIGALDVGCWSAQDVGEPDDRDASAPAALSIWVSPNPIGGTTSIRLSALEAGDLRVRIFDMAGREVRNLLAHASAPGLVSLAWDGRDDAGMLVSAGVYWVRASQGDRKAATRVLVLR